MVAGDANSTLSGFIVLVSSRCFRTYSFSCSFLRRGFFAIPVFLCSFALMLILGHLLPVGGMDGGRLWRAARHKFGRGDS